MATTKKAAAKAAPKTDDEVAEDKPETVPTLLRSDTDTTLDDVPDNTPPVRVAAEDAEGEDDKGDAPEGYAYVIHPKSGARCLVDAKSLPELQVDGYQLG